MGKAPKKRRHRQVSGRIATRIGVLVASLGFAVCVSQLWLQLDDHWSRRRTDLFIELKPSASAESTVFSRDPISSCVVFEFPFDGRIANVGQSATSLESWDTIGIPLPDATSQPASYQGSSGLFGNASGASVSPAEYEELSFPLFLAPGVEIRFMMWLRVELPEEHLTQELSALVSSATTGRVAVSDLAENWPALEADARDVTEASSYSLISTRRPAGIRVCFSVVTSAGLRAGYSFLWDPPDSILDAHEIQGDGCD